MCAPNPPQPRGHTHQGRTISIFQYFPQVTLESFQGIINTQSTYQTNPTKHQPKNKTIQLYLTQYIVYQILSNTYIRHKGSLH